MTTNMNDFNKNTDTKLKDALFNRIEDENLQPRSRIFFKSRECVMWALWLMSIFIGALAVAISVFVVLHHQYALYEATHTNFLTFLVDILPFVWLAVFVFMTYFALYNLRHTKHGYRYSVTTILCSSIVLSFALGSALQFFGLGYTIDSQLGKQMKMYMSQEKVEVKLWQQPESGRMVGVQVLDTVEPEKFIIFEDVSGNRWRIDVIELFPEDKALLADMRRVRLLGEVTDLKNKLFHACGVFSWVFNENTTRSDLSTSRQSFVDKMGQFKVQAENRLAEYEKQTFESASATNTLPMSVCANIALAR